MAEIVLEDAAWGDAVVVLVLVLVVLGIITAFAIHRKVLFRLGARNVARRPGQTALVLVGLLVGTAILSGAMVASDTMQFAIVKEVYTGTDLIDETVSVSGGRTFNRTVYDELERDPELSRHTDGLSPILEMTGVTVFDTVSQQTEPSVTFHGIDPVLDRDFGRFETTEGETIDGTGLTGNQTVINKRLARALEAKPGHMLELYYVPPAPLVARGPGGNGTGPGGNGTAPGGNDTGPSSPSIMSLRLTVAHIVRNEGKANLNNGKMVFVTLERAQEMLNASDSINKIKVSNNGGVVAGADGTQKVLGDLERIIGKVAPELGVPTSTFKIETIKKDAVEIAETSSESLQDFLLMASSFTVAAGVMLIINIFVMLAEERKRELGISRAVGMKRSYLVRTFLFEGTLYSLAASVIGAYMGIVVAWFLIQGVFSAVGAGGMDVPFYYKNSSLLMAFGLGFLITIGTVLLASWRSSKLNIVRAIRSIDEPVHGRGTRKGFLGGIGLLVMGGLLSFAGFGPEDGSGIIRLLGPNLLLMGTGIVIRRWAGLQAGQTFAGLAVLAYSMYFLFYEEVSNDEGMIALVIMGLLMVFGAVLALVSNSKYIVSGLGRALSFSPRTKAVAEPAIGHPLNKGFRTGMTIAMFSLVIFIVLLFSIFFTIFTPDLEEASGGYDLMARSTVPVQDIENITVMGGGGGQVEYDTLRRDVDEVHSLVEHPFWGNFRKDGNEVPTYGPPFHNLYGVDKEFTEKAEFTLNERAKNYSSNREAWNALIEDPSLAIIDSSSAGTQVPIEVGDEVGLPPSAGGDPNRTYRIIGIVESVLFNGLIVQKEGVLQDFPVRGNDLFYMKVKEGRDLGEVAKDLEGDFSIVGMNVVQIEKTLRESMEAIQDIFQMFELFMSLGLVVGIASLGVISVRSVIERRQEIGIMRAIGYRKSMVMATFSLEMLFITTMGVLLGVAIGYIAGYGIWKSGMEAMGVSFSVPWGRIGLILAVTYIAALLCTILPAYRASRTNPAEAVRWVE